MTKPPNDFESERKYCPHDITEGTCIQCYRILQSKASQFERTIAEYEHECETINEMRAERNYARTEVEMLKEMSAKRDQADVAGLNKRDELRSLAARMAEVLKFYVNAEGSTMAADSGGDGQDVLAAYEAFERGNKG